MFMQPSLAADADQTGSKALPILQKVQAAARELDYAGVFTYQQGAAMQSNQVIHVVDGTGERERLSMLDGPAREFLRHNDTVQCLIPEQKLVLIEPRHGERFPGVLIGDGKKISKFYTLKISSESNRIAGRDCTTLELTPKDDYRYGYNFCVDTETNLLIKAQTLNGPNELVDQILFTSLQIGSAVPADQLKSQWNTRDWKILQMPIQPIDLSKLGWRIASPPGFDSITQVSRPMKGGKSVKQLVMSDGLAAISVFIEPYDSSRKPLSAGAATRGAINIYGARIGDHWLTAIGEVPADTLRELAERTEYVPLAATQ
ncbi:MAG TPA: MucB/RseB C-terminal domain-containing protein [Eoetvoesiella sp.]